MGAIKDEIPTENVFGGLTGPDYKNLGEMLIRFIPEDKKSELSGKLVSCIAKANNVGSDGPIGMTTKELYLEVCGNKNEEPSKWMSQPWRAISTKLLPNLRPLLIRESIKNGLTYYPYIRKIGGRQTRYKLVAVEISEPAPYIHEKNSACPEGGVQYKVDQEIAMSSVGKLFFSKGINFNALTRYAYATLVSAFMIAGMFLAWLAWQVVYRSNNLFDGKVVSILFVYGILAWLAYKLVKLNISFINNRIAIAPDWALTWAEDGATIEINRLLDKDRASRIEVKRYTATCPCGWMIKLHDGGVEFNHRIIGKCEEHPQEHVFSFDRYSKIGLPLRGSVIGGNVSNKLCDVKNMDAE